MTETAERPIWPRLALVAAAFVGAVALLALGVGAYNSRLEAQQEARLVAAIEEAEAELDAAEPNWRLEALLAALPEVPDGENGARRALSVAPGVPDDWPDADEAAKWEGVDDNRAMDAAQLAALDRVLGPLKAERLAARELAR